MDTEDEGTSDRDPDEEWGDGVEGDGLRGWISPDDRLWRHPSEAAKSPSLRIEPAPSTVRAWPGPWIVGGATSVILVALVVAAVVMTTAGTADQSSADNSPGLASLTGVPTTDPGAGPASSPATIAAMVAAVRPSTVAIEIRKAHATTAVSGLVVESGGIIVTSSVAMAGARSMTVVEPDGDRRSADLVGADAATGLAVVRIADDLPAATFDGLDPQVGSTAVATSLEPGSRARRGPSSLVYAGTVVSTGRSVGHTGRGTDFSTTAITAPLTRSDVGCPLLDGNGHVIGMLAWTEGTGSSARAVFLPAELVLGVSRQLVALGTVDHGWLGIQSSDAPAAITSAGSPVVTSASGPDGARLDAVAPDSPAAQAGLTAGDVVTGIDGEPVHSAAELRSRLYPDPPGATLEVTFVRNGITSTCPVVLAEADTDAPGAASSP